METIKLLVTITPPNSDITKNYKLLLYEDGKAKNWESEIKIKFLKYLKLHFHNPDNYLIFTTFYSDCQFLITNHSDFLQLLSDFTTESIFSPQILNFSILENKKTSKKKRAHVYYHKNGGINTERTNIELIIDRPSNEIFTNETIEVFCAFCHESSHNKAYLELLGPFYGPFALKKEKKKKDYYVHETCVIWSPRVYLNSKTSRLENVEEEIQRGKKIFCTYCKLKGGTLGCNEKKCGVTYHAKCLWENEQIIPYYLNY